MHVRTALLIAMGLVVLACFVSLVRIERHGALQCRTAAWGALLCTSLLSAGLGNPLAASEADASRLPIFAMLACATSLPFFLLAGAYAWVQRPIPQWLAWIGLAASLAHGVLGIAAPAVLAELLIVPVEVATVLLAAWLLWRGRFRHERPLMSVPLAGMHALRAGVEAAMGFVYALRLPISDAYSVAGSLLLFASHVYSEDGELLGRVWSSRDVTEERRLGQQLRHSQKLETLGTLSSGIAHDFNNRLAVILGNARHLQRELESVQGPTGNGQPPDDVHECLGDLERAAEHCAQLTRSLLTFARRAPPTIQSLDTARVMSGLRKLLRPLIPSTIAIEIVLEPDLPAIAADPVQLQQVLVNLAVNARDAMKDRGAITLAARACLVGPERARSVVGGRQRAFAELSASDTGDGIDPECLGRIFEPFDTTKSVGEGTTFRAVLPVSEGSPSVRSVPGARGDANGDETELSADDESGIRRLVRRALASRGYTVIEAFDGDDALLRWRSRREQIDAIVLDLTMPGRDRLSARRAILAEAPGLPILITSGNVLGQPAEGIDFLAKPFQLTEFAARLREVIDRGRGSWTDTPGKEPSNPACQP